MRKRKWQPEDYIVVFVAAVLICLLFFFLNGCKSTQDVQDTHLIWHDGQCFLVARNMSAEQAHRMLKDISLEKCKVQFADDLNQGAVPRKESLSSEDDP